MTILGIIPARGGSKGIPGKNMKSLGGKPLIQYTIEAAIASNYLTKVVLSSDDDDIREFARTSGIDVPFQRPGELARDDSPTLPVIQHAVRYFESHGLEFDAICLLQPTSPFRGADLIDRAIESFMQSGTDSLISVKSVPHQYNPHWIFKPLPGGQLEPFTPDKAFISRRQDLPPVYHRDGLIYLTRTSVVLEKDSLYGDSISYITTENLPAVNLDSPEDWEQAELWLLNQKGL